MPDAGIFVFGEWLYNHASFRLTHGARHSLMLSAVDWTTTAPGTGCQYGACLWENKPYCVEREKGGLGLHYFSKGEWREWEGAMPGNIEKVLAALEEQEEPRTPSSRMMSPTHFGAAVAAKGRKY